MIVAATGCSPAWLLTGAGSPFPAAAPSPATGNAMMAQAAASFAAACEMMALAAPLTDGSTLPDTDELAAALLRVKLAIDRRHDEIDAGDGGE